MRFRFGIVLALAAMLLACSSGSKRAGNGQNILLIVLDAARPDHFSSYGYSRHTTPNIDRIAGERVRFTMAFSTSSWTLPAHASLFTGLLPDEHKTNSRHPWLIDRIPTLAKLLSQNGYRTAGFSNNPFVDRAQNLSRGFARFEAIWADSTVTDSIHPYDTPYTNCLVDAFIDSCSGGNEPFFAFINYMETIWTPICPIIRRSRTIRRTSASHRPTAPAWTACATTAISSMPETSCRAKRSAPW